MCSQKLSVYYRDIDEIQEFLPFVNTITSLVAVKICMMSFTCEDIDVVTGEVKWQAFASHLRDAGSIRSYKHVHQGDSGRRARPRCYQNKKRVPDPNTTDSCFGLVRPQQHGTASR